MCARYSFCYWVANAPSFPLVNCSDQCSNWLQPLLQAVLQVPRAMKSCDMNLIIPRRLTALSSKWTTFSSMRVIKLETLSLSRRPMAKTLATDVALCQVSNCCSGELPHPARCKISTCLRNWKQFGALRVADWTMVAPVQIEAILKRSGHHSSSPEKDLHKLICIVCRVVFLNQVWVDIYKNQLRQNLCCRVSTWIGYGI